MFKLIDWDREFCFRINIGKLVDKFCKGCIRGILFLYGLCLFLNDIVWVVFMYFDFELYIFEKNLKNKEKEVDIEMVLDFVERVIEFCVGVKSDMLIME